MILFATRLFTSNAQYLHPYQRMKRGWLPVSHGHRLYYEQYGKGRPVVILHGGPGGGMDRAVMRTFDLTQWCVLLFDQRGCGKSTPSGSLAHNTTWDLVDDIERFRVHCGVEAWFVSGGSWGSTLALAYAEKHPRRVTGLLLRGTCLSDEDSFRWLYQKGGASEVYPDAWKGFLSVVPPRLHDADWHTLVRYYQRGLSDSRTMQRYADAWSNWEQQISYARPRPNRDTPQTRLLLARLENHYFVHRCWLKPGQLQRGLWKLRHLPFTMIHGRYDMVCPISAAFAVQAALPHAVLEVTPDAGHAFSETGTTRRFRHATLRALRQGTRRTLRAKKHDA